MEQELTIGLSISFCKISLRRTTEESDDAVSVKKCKIETTSEGLINGKLSGQKRVAFGRGRGRGRRLKIKGGSASSCKLGMSSTAFNNLIWNIDMSDMGYYYQKFAWCNNSRGQTQIREHLNSDLINSVLACEVLILPSF